MHILELFIIKLSRGLDFLAGIILAATATLVVANILGRALLGQSILGTYEMVGFFTAAVVGLSLSRCALENGHIAVGFLVEKLPGIVQKVLYMVINVPVIIFLTVIGYNLYLYGARIAATGEVSPTTQMIFHPFIYMAAFGFLVLALTVLLKLLQQFKGGERS